MIKVEEQLTNDATPPLVWAVIHGQDASIDEVCAWLADRQRAVNTVLDHAGALLVRGFSALTSAEAFERVLGIVAPQLIEYVGGTSPRTAVRGKIMTATELPPAYSLALHQEMTYTDNPPDRVAFFCERPATTRGYTTLGDMRPITQRIDRSVRERWKRGGIQLRRTLSTRETAHKKPGVAKLWSEVFDTQDRGRVEAVADQRGWRLTWLPDDSLQLWQEVRPATKVYAKTGDEVWFNQAHIFAPGASIEWARRDGRHEDVRRLQQARSEHPDMLDAVFHGDGTMIDDAEVLHVYDVLARAEIPVHWQRSDVLLLNNTLIAHGRTPFGGERAILAALIRDTTALGAPDRGVSAASAAS